MLMCVGVPTAPHTMNLWVIAAQGFEFTLSVKRLRIEAHDCVSSVVGYHTRNSAQATFGLPNSTIIDDRAVHRCVPYTPVPKFMFRPAQKRA